MSSIALRLTVLAAAALTVVAVAGAAPTSYLDPSGDNGASADIGAVTAELASDGYVHVKATIANMPTTESSGFFLLGVDTDRSGSTGLFGGADYVVLGDPGLQFVFLRWDGSDYVDAPAQAGDVRFFLGGGGFEFLVRPAALGGVTSFNFVLGAATGSGDGAQLDIAPDGGTWFYEVQKPAPAPAPAVAVSAKVTFAPALPRAGRAFRVTAASVRLDDGSTAAAQTFRCRATLAGKALRGAGAGGCTFAVPKTAKGKRLVVTVSATYGGRTLSTAPRAFVVR
jgi:hypothetical protein